MNFGAVRDSRSATIREMFEGWGIRTEVLGQRTEDGGQRIKDGGQGDE